MEEILFFADKSCGNEPLRLKFEEDEEEFKSCFEDEDELRDREECHMVDFKGNISVDDGHAKMYVKGVSVPDPGDAGTRISGIGVVIDRPWNGTQLRIQKKLDFYEEAIVAEYLALLDGLALAIQKYVRKISVLTDSEVMHTQLMNDDEVVDIPLVRALRKRILEQANDIESFVLKLVPTTTVGKALNLARVAVGFVSTPDGWDEWTEICTLCGKQRLLGMMFTIKCSHKFCSHCMRSYVDGKLKSARFPIRCPQSGCRYCISASEFRLFLTDASYESLHRAHDKANLICCPYSASWALFDPRECWSSEAISLNQTDSICEGCYACQHFTCRDCDRPWRSPLTCEEFRSLSLEERYTRVMTFYHLVHNKEWRICTHCRGIVKLNNDCYHMQCRCGYEFCFTCGAEYREGEYTCHCALRDAGNSIDESSYPPRNVERWAWDSLESPPMRVDAYSDQGRSLLELIKRFLPGGYSLGEHDSDQAAPRCTDSYAETMRDLHQLPWLQGFVSVISDNNYEGHIQ